jgi:ketosteroid isomerase-like protein
VSQENINLGERLVAAVNAGALSDALAEQLLTPDFRIDNASTAVTDKTYYGAAGMREWARDFFEAFDGDAHWGLETVAHGDDYLVSMNRLVGHGAASGAPLELRWAGVSWFRDGKVARATGYARRREALEAVGLGQ